MTDFMPGDIVKHIVGMPGPDIDVATIVAKRDDGNYSIRFQVWGEGKWYDGIGIPGKQVIGGIFK
jgi:hypothetical protein